MARPNLSYLKNLALVLTGVAVGAVSGLTGMGGALVLSPALAYLLGLRERKLAATTLIVTTVAAAFALVAYGQAHLLSLRAVLIFAVASVVGVGIGAAAPLAPWRSSRAVSILASVLTLSLSIWMIYNVAAIAGSAGAPRMEPSLPGLFGAGFASAFIGKVGSVGGVLTVPAMVLIVGLVPARAQATALAAIVLISAIPTAMAASRKEPAPAPTFWSSFGAALGALAGSQFAVKLTATDLLLVYGVGLFAIGFVRLFSSMASRRQ
jgi:hypothetical protein